MLLATYTICLLLAALSTAEQEDLTSSSPSAELAAVRLKDIQEQLLQLKHKLNTLTSQVAILLERDQSCDRQTVITDCNETGSKQSGIFPLRICTEPLYRVYCNQSFEGGGWMVIYHRNGGQRDGTFNQTWESYKRGFGQPDGEHFIGLDRLHSITYGSSYEIAFLLPVANGEQETVGIYDRFEVDSERERYAIKSIGSARGNLRLFADNNQQLYKFHTYDRNNLHPLARTTMLEEECAFWFVDMPHGHDTGGFQQFCANLRRLKVMIRKRPTGTI